MSQGYIVPKAHFDVTYETVSHKAVMESSRHINTQAKAGMGRHRTYASENVPGLPPGMWVVGPHGLTKKLSSDKIRAVACGVSVSLWRLAAQDGEGRILDLGQPLSADTLDAKGKPLDVYGAEKAQRIPGLEQKGVPPYVPLLDYARRGLTPAQSVFLINAFRVAHSLGKPLEVYLPGSEYRIWTNEYGNRLGVDANKLLDAHFEVLETQIRRIGRKLFPKVKVKVQDTARLLTEAVEPFEGHWTRAVAKKVGMGSKLLEIAKRDDAASTHIFKTMRKDAGLFLLQPHATGIANDAKPYDPQTQGLHMVVSSAPVVYLEREVNRLKRRHGAEIESTLNGHIDDGEEMGHPAAEYYFGAGNGNLWDPQGQAFHAYAQALKEIPGFKKLTSLRGIVNKLNQIATK